MADPLRRRPHLSITPAAFPALAPPAQAPQPDRAVPDRTWPACAGTAGRTCLKAYGQ